MRPVHGRRLAEPSPEGLAEGRDIGEPHTGRHGAEHEHGAGRRPLPAGVSKWSATRHDLLARDAGCAAADRAANAVAHRADCAESAIADLTRVDELRSQRLDAAERAVTAGELRAGDGRRVRRLAAKIRRPPVRQRATTAVRYHRKAARALGRACRVLSAAGR